jgi:tRNA A-37 threonylcarbamoyl transferase component Bud32
MTDLHAVFRLKNEAFVIKEADAEMILVPLVNDIVDMTNMLTLNAVASSIVKAIDGKKTLEDICLQLHHEYEVDENVLKNDVIQFVTNALEKNIVEQVN